MASRKAKRSGPVAERMRVRERRGTPVSTDTLTQTQKLLKRLATNAVREACESRRGRLTPRAILAYQWLTEAADGQQVWTLGWVCLEVGWCCSDWRAKALRYVHKNWRRLAWQQFMRDLESRSRQVRALATPSYSGYLGLVEMGYWHEIANVEVEERPAQARFGETADWSQTEPDESLHP